MKERPMGAKLVNGKHEATPTTDIHVDGGDTIAWGPGSELLRFDESPFNDGAKGPFKSGTTSLVKKGLTTRKFPCVGGTNGQIIVDNP